jgi:hypothetical protein
MSPLRALRRVQMLFVPPQKLQGCRADSIWSTSDPVSENREPRTVYPSCPRIARASEAGSEASVMGRPTTMCEAPAAIASAGVTTRA